MLQLTTICSQRFFFFRYKERKHTIAKFVKKKNGLSVPEEIRLSRPGEHYGKKEVIGGAGTAAQELRK